MKKQPPPIKRLVALLSVLILISIKIFSGKSDASIRDSVVLIKSSKGQCSGVQVEAPSKVNYILTAGHCLSVSEDNKTFTITSEDHKTTQRKILVEDPTSDLLLVEGLPGKSGLQIADISSRFEEVRTFTHGGGHDTYQTHGLIIDTRMATALVGEGESCPKMPKFQVVDTIFGKLCILAVEETTITAPIIPGSSGGPVVDPRGDLIGIVSMGGDGLYYMVTLKDIKNFLNNY